MSNHFSLLKKMMVLIISVLFANGCFGMFGAEVSLGFSLLPSVFASDNEPVDIQQCLLSALDSADPDNVKKALRAGALVSPRGTLQKPLQCAYDQLVKQVKQRLRYDPVLIRSTQKAQDLWKSHLSGIKECIILLLQSGSNNQEIITEVIKRAGSENTVEKIPFRCAVLRLFRSKTICSFAKNFFFEGKKIKDLLLVTDAPSLKKLCAVTIENRAIDFSGLPESIIHDVALDKRAEQANSAPWQYCEIQ